MKNLEIANIFRNIAQILEIKGGNVFRIRAYERAAQNLEGLSEDLGHIIGQGRLREIPGIGSDLEAKIREFDKSGKIKAYEELKKTIPPGLLDLLNISSIGPKTAKLLYEQAKVKSVAGLEKAIKKGKLAGIPGIKNKTIENISKGIALFKKGKERMTLAQAVLAAEPFLRALDKLPQVKNISAAGSLRRQKETVRDIDILVASDKPRKVMQAFVDFPAVKQVLAKGDTKSAVRTESGVQIDCRVVERSSFGAALLYFTGSKNFNVKLRRMAIKRGLKINEYGIYRGRRFICGASENEIFKALGMAYVEPELREDSGEIELALKNRLPELITAQDIKGDLHVHSKWSDGGNTVEEMAQAAQKLGYAYIAVTDHSQSLKVASGLSPDRLKRKKAEIARVNQKLKNFRVLYATEVDITGDGGIDYSDAVLKEFDIVVAAIHTGFKQPRDKLTARIIRACKNKYVHIIAHPTGKLWGVREPYDLDTDLIFRAAADTNTSLEINAFPQRLDLNSSHCRRAKELGVRFSIDTDAHITDQLKAMPFGLAVARRGWLSRSDVINTLDADRLLNTIKK